MPVYVGSGQLMSSLMSTYVSLCQPMSTYVNLCQPMSTYVRSDKKCIDFVLDPGRWGKLLLKHYIWWPYQFGRQVNECVHHTCVCTVEQQHCSTSSESSRHVSLCSSVFRLSMKSAFDYQRYSPWDTTQMGVHYLFTVKLGENDFNGCWYMYNRHRKISTDIDWHWLTLTDINWHQLT